MRRWSLLLHETAPPPRKQAYAMVDGGVDPNTLCIWAHLTIENLFDKVASCRLILVCRLSKSWDVWIVFSGAELSAYADAVFAAHVSLKFFRP